MEAFQEIRRVGHNFSLILIPINAGEVRCNVQYFSVVTRSSYHINQMVEFRSKIVCWTYLRRNHKPSIRSP